MEKIPLKTYQITINSTPEEMENFKEMFDVVDVKEIKKTRTLAQNSSLHLWFTQLSEVLNEKHFTVREILIAGAEVEWTPTLVKEIMWRRLQMAMFGKKSTTQLFKSKEIDQIFDTIANLVIERTHGEVEIPPWPDKDSLREYE